VKSVLILGAGFGGLELATRLSEDAADEFDVTMVDQSDAFTFGFSKLDLLFGRSDLPGVRLPYANFEKPNVRYSQETVTSIDAAERTVTTDRGTYQPDILVVALGADLDPAATPGMVEEGTEFYSVNGAARLAERLPSFAGGNVVVGVLGGFYKCPAAPYEAAFMMHDYLTQRGLRDKSEITIISPMGVPIPISKEASDGISAIFDEQDIGWWPGSKITEVDGAAKEVRLEDGRSAPYDLLLGIPVHRAPRVVEESALPEDGWIPVDLSTFATRFEGVFAVGDVTSAPVPRVGAMAEGEARVLADALISHARGGPAPEPFKGIATCYIEMGGSLVARFDANFLGGSSGPSGTFTEASEAGRAAKHEFGAARRQRWFGLDG
jgi:sulfide:quinone oxidoreductase